MALTTVAKLYCLFVLSPGFIAWRFASKDACESLDLAETERRRFWPGGGALEGAPARCFAPNQFDKRLVWSWSGNPGVKQPRLETINGTYDVQHDVVAQARRAVDADQDAVLDGRAEAHRQPVRPRARPLVIGPRVRDQSASFAEDVRGARCG